MEHITQNHSVLVGLSERERGSVLVFSKSQRNDREGGRGRETKERERERERAAAEYKPLSRWLQLDLSSSTHTCTHTGTREVEGSESTNQRKPFRGCMSVVVHFNP